jgi:hypothetical protein
MRSYKSFLYWTLHISVCFLIWVLLPENSYFIFFALCFVSAMLSDTASRWAVGAEQSSVLRTVQRIYVHSLKDDSCYTMLKDSGMSSQKLQELADKTPDPDKNVEIYRVEVVGIQVFGARFIWNRTPKS